MKTNYCPHCQSVQNPALYQGTYTIALCAPCLIAVGIEHAPHLPPEQPEAAREDIDAPIPQVPDSDLPAAPQTQPQQPRDSAPPSGDAPPN